MRNFKKAISALLAAIMAFSAFSALPVTAGAAEIDGKAEAGAQQQAVTVSATQDEATVFDYKVLEDGTAEITDYTGKGTELVVPSEIDGYKVTSIGNYAFAYCKSITSATIGKSVTNIGFGAFHNCSSLETLNFNAVKCKDISLSYNEADYYLSYCPSLTTVNIGENVEYIPAFAFSLQPEAYRRRSVQRLHRSYRRNNPRQRDEYWQRRIC